MMQITPKQAFDLTENLKIQYSRIEGYQVANVDHLISTELKIALDLYHLLSDNDKNISVDIFKTDTPNSYDIVFESGTITFTITPNKHLIIFEPYNSLEVPTIQKVIGVKRSYIHSSHANDMKTEIYSFLYQLVKYRSDRIKKFDEKDKSKILDLVEARNLPLALQLLQSKDI